MSEQQPHTFAGPVIESTGGTAMESRDIMKQESLQRRRKHDEARQAAASGQTANQSNAPESADGDCVDMNAPADDAPAISTTGAIVTDLEQCARVCGERETDECVAETLATIERHPLHREILYKALVACETEQTVETLEETIESYPEYTSAGQSAHALIGSLVRAGGLSFTQRDEAGEVVDDARREQARADGAGEDAVEDLVASEWVRTTPAGRQAAERFSPLVRIHRLMARHPEHVAGFSAALELIANEPMMYPQFQQAFSALHIFESPANRPPANVAAISHSAAADSLPLAAANTPSRNEAEDSSAPARVQPSYYIDALAAAGALFWQDGLGWCITEEGRGYLEQR